MSTTPHPSSPAGMSKPAIRKQLIEAHGWTEEKARGLLTMAACQNALIQARLDAGDGLSPERKAALHKGKGAPFKAVSQARTDTTAKADAVADERRERAIAAAARLREPDPVTVEEDDDDDFDDLADLLDEEPEVQPEPEPTIEEVADQAEEIIEQVAEILDGTDWDPSDLDALLSGEQPSIGDPYDTAEDVGFDGPHPDDTDTDLSDLDSLLDEVAEAQPQPLFIGMPGTLDYRFDGHAGAGPSAAERWMNCTASLGAVREFLETLTPNQQHQFAGGGEAARQGTTAHAVAENEVRLLLGEITPEEHTSTLLELTLEPEQGEAYDDEMGEYITEYTDYVQTFIDAGHEVRVEQRVEALIPLTVEGAYAHTYEDGDTLPDWYAITGSADLAVMPLPGEMVLTVGDLKYGTGLDVDVEENPQIRLYALGVLATLADEEGNLPALERIDYAIIQPRLGGLKVWTESVDDLLTWRDEVLSPALTAALGLDGLATYQPSELACQWCPVRGSCPALTKQRVEAAAELFDVVVESEVAMTEVESGALDNERLASLLAQVEGLVSLREDIKAEAQRRLHRGETLPGYQLVNYTPPRRWVEGAESDPALAKKPVWKPATLLTPKQALTVMGENAKQIESLIVSEPIRPVIAKIGDRRKTWTGIPPEQMFPETDDMTGE